MERCPNCGQESRVGAKYCTTCGSRMPEANADNESGTEPGAQFTAETASVDTSQSGWPAPAAPAEPSPYSAWAPPPATANAAEPILAAGEGNEASPNPWSSGMNNTWPAPPGEAPQPSPQDDDTAPSNEPGDVEIDEFAAAADDDGANTAATDRISRLLDELRDAIFTFHGQAGVDLSPVIADLEVAVTPPGAVNPETLSELRDALLAARAKPRDIDTIVALTGQLDSLVALVFAYDRTIAAIERALEVLRRD